MNKTLAGKLENNFFEGANQMQLTEHRLEQLGIRLRPVLGSRSEFDPWGAWF
jgi:hypothetical protein